MNGCRKKMRRPFFVQYKRTAGFRCRKRFPGFLQPAFEAVMNTASGQKRLKERIFLDSINKQRLYFTGSRGFDKPREI